MSCLLIVNAMSASEDYFIYLSALDKTPALVQGTITHLGHTLFLLMLESLGRCTDYVFNQAAERTSKM